MLYVTTRNKQDAYTTNRALNEDRGPEGGLYVPFRPPVLTAEELRDLPFEACVAEVLNRMFRKELTVWDVRFAIGRDPVRLKNLSHRIVVAELWHNPRGSYAFLEENLRRLLKTESQSGWANIAIRIAVLAGIYGELLRQDVAQADLSAVSGDFSAPISGWYARAWGVPVGNLVCVCNENRNLWELFSHGLLRTDGVSTDTLVPEADVVVPQQLERLISECGGVREVQRYLDAVRTGTPYSPGEAVLMRLKQGLNVCVVSTDRMSATIPSVYRTHSYLLSPGGALAYGGLLDYRAKTGQAGAALVLEDQSPLCTESMIAQMLDIPVSRLREIL